MKSLKTIITIIALSVSTIFSMSATEKKDETKPVTTKQEHEDEMYSNRGQVFL